MNFKKLLLIFFLYSSISFAQNENSSNSFFTFNASSNFYFRQLGGYYTDLQVPKNGSQYNYSGPYIKFKDKHSKDGLYVSVGAEILYNFKRNNYFNCSFGIAYNYVKDFYDYSYSNTSSNGSKTIRTTGIGSGELTNHLTRFVFSLNWTTKKHFTFYIRPLNYEIRFVKSNSIAQYSEYDVIYKKKPSSYGASGKPNYEDSIKTLVKEYEAPIDFVRSVSLSFPSSIGIEQKFQFKKVRLNAGLSFGCSLLELYYVPRAYIGICFGSFKD